MHVRTSQATTLLPTGHFSKQFSTTTVKRETFIVGLLFQYYNNCTHNVPSMYEVLLFPILPSLYK